MVSEKRQQASVTAFIGGLALLIGTVADAGYSCDRLDRALTPLYVGAGGSGGMTWSTRPTTSKFPKSFCQESVVLPPVNAEEFRLYRPELFSTEYIEHGMALQQEISSCFVSGQFLYFGLEVYHGEGARMLGGLGRLDTVSGQIAIHRDRDFASDSITMLVADAGVVWGVLGFESEAEFGPGRGLFRHDWADGSTSYLDRQTDAENGVPCGMRYNSMYFHEGEIWVGSDLGISKFVMETSSWSHHVVNPTSQLLEATSCAAVLHETYARLPNDVRSDEDITCNLYSGSPRQGFIQLLKATRPKLYQLIANAETEALLAMDLWFQHRLINGFLDPHEIAKLPPEQAELAQRAVEYRRAGYAEFDRLIDQGLLDEDEILRLSPEKAERARRAVAARKAKASVSEQQ